MVSPMDPVAVIVRSAVSIVRAGVAVTAVIGRGIAIAAVAITIAIVRIAVAIGISRIAVAVIAAVIRSGQRAADQRARGQADAEPAPAPAAVPPCGLGRSRK